MDNRDKTRPASPARGTTVECCTESACESGLKNNYFEGKRLTPDMFRVEQRYHVGRRHLLNRAIHGSGVVYGYGIAAADGGRRSTTARTLQIGSGLALDCCGRELVQVEPTPLDLGNVIVLDSNGKRTDAARAFTQASYARKEDDTCWLLSVHYAELDTAHVRVPDPCECDAHEWDHVCETVRYSLRQISCKECCTDEPCGLECECGRGPCCEPEDAANGTKQQDQQSHRQAPLKRGGCRCICDHLTALNFPEDCCDRLCEIEEACGRVRVDLAHGVDLACIDIVRDECGDWTFAESVEACGPRRLVKRNDLLYDLIRGCDLTRIIEFGWARWHRCEEEVPFEDFSEAIGSEGKGQDEYVTRDFWVKFSRPVRKSTLRPDCIAITVLSAESRWQEMHRVPVVRIDTELVLPEDGDPKDHVRSARVVVDGAWVEHALRGSASRCRSETWIEIEIRGDFIEDCNGQTVDINAHGLSKSITGNGTPGGTFLSTFRVGPKTDRRSPPYSADRLTGASS